MLVQATESSLLGIWSPPQALEACRWERKLNAQPSGHTATSEPNKETEKAETSQAGVHRPSSSENLCAGSTCWEL